MIFCVQSLLKQFLRTFIIIRNRNAAHHVQLTLVYCIKQRWNQIRQPHGIPHIIDPNTKETRYSLTRT